MNKDSFVPALRQYLIPIREAAGMPLVSAFLPPDLPPDLPEIDWNFALKIIEAKRAISELKGLAATLPNPYLLSNAFARREATLSSNIEGTESVLRELLLFEAGDDAARENRRARNLELRACNGARFRAREGDSAVFEFIAGDARNSAFRRCAWSRKKPRSVSARSGMIGKRGCRLHEARYVPPPWEGTIGADITRA